MNFPTKTLQQDAVAPLTHIFLSLDLLEDENNSSEDNRHYLAIIRQNAERLQSLIQQKASQ